MSNLLKTIYVLLLISITYVIVSPNKKSELYPNLYGFIKDLSAEELFMYQSLKEKKGFLEALRFFHSPSYQRFKLYKKNAA